MAKLSISQSRKDFLKANFDSVKKSDLQGDEKRYWTLINNGKNRSKKGVRFEGRFIGGELVETIKKVAEKKGVSVNTYLKQNSEEVERIIESGYTFLQKQPETVIDAIHGSGRKTIEVFDGESVRRVPKMQVIERIVKLQQWAASNTTMVQLGIPTRLYLSGKIRVNLPPSSDFSDDMDEEGFEALLEELEIWFVKSDKADKKNEQGKDATK